MQYYYYDTSTWTGLQQCGLEPVVSIFAVEASNLIEADTIFRSVFQYDPAKKPGIVVQCIKTSSCATT
jgi:hypothetical protein